MCYTSIGIFHFYCSQVSGVVVIIVSSVLSQALCYFVCATVCCMNVGVFEHVGYPTDHWVVECKGGPFLSLFPGFLSGFRCIEI